MTLILLITGVRYATLLGVLAGLASVVPIVGNSLGAPQRFGSILSGAEGFCLVGMVIAVPVAGIIRVALDPLAPTEDAITISPIDSRENITAVPHDGRSRNDASSSFGFHASSGLRGRFVVGNHPPGVGIANRRREWTFHQRRSPRAN